MNEEDRGYDLVLPEVLERENAQLLLFAKYLKKDGRFYFSFLAEEDVKFFTLEEKNTIVKFLVHYIMYFLMDPNAHKKTN